ncbi:MAG TPA: DmsC/YnfH family molybdoenzyme membrane anchor subunit, partial [Anaerolineales bacterium]|nr:DmsC/YnfH family molybdoenzyme membrane anchor subunit [Anaerolineales bacterium]
MDTREWALLIFTILGQTAAGTFLVLLIVRTFIKSKAGVEQADKLTTFPLYIVVPVMALALLSSLFHLGSPLNIIKAVPNLTSSWLSREVVISVVFTVLAVLYNFMYWRKIGSEQAKTILGWITALVGIFQVYGMAMVYMIRTQPAWNTLATPVSFFTTALLLGVLTVAAGLIVSYSRLSKAPAKQTELLRGVLQGLALTSIILLGIEFLVLPLYMAYLSSLGSAAIQTLNLMTGSFGSTLALRLILVFIGAGLLAAYLYRNASIPGKESTFSTLIYSALALVLVSEVMGRFIFYATHV